MDSKPKEKAKTETLSKKSVENVTKKKSGSGKGTIKTGTETPLTTKTSSNTAGTATPQQPTKTASKTEPTAPPKMSKKPSKQRIIKRQFGINDDTMACNSSFNDENNTNEEESSYSNKEGDPQSSTNSKHRVKCRQLRTIDLFLSYISTRFPHFSQTFLPFFLLNFLADFVIEHLDIFDQLFEFKTKTYKKMLKPFYKHPTVQGNYLMDIANVSDFSGMAMPYIDMAITTAAICSIFLFGIRTKRIIIWTCSLVSLSFFAAPHLTELRYICLFIVQICIIIYIPASQVLVMESLPKYHRVIYYVLFRMSADLAQVAASLILVLSGNHGVMNYDYFYHVAASVTLLITYYGYFHIHDTLFNLLTVGKFFRLEKGIKRYIKLSKMDLPASTIVDSIAFENFESSDSYIEVILRLLRNRKIMFEIGLNSVLFGNLDRISLALVNELKNRGEISFFDKILVKPASNTVTTIYMLAFAFLLPKVRVFPAYLAAILMFIFYELSIFFLPSFDSKNRVCETFTKIEWSSIILICLTISMSQIIRFYAQIRLIEMTPSIARVPVLCITRAIQYIFVGAAIEVKAAYSGGSLGFELCAVPFLIFLMTPTKKLEMAVYFSEHKKNENAEKRAPTAPNVK